jgi:hypothetical protein
VAKLIHSVVGDEAARWLHESGTINKVAAALKAAFRTHSMIKKAAASTLTQAVMPIGSIM